MLDPEFSEDSQLLIRTCQILVLAMAAGCVMFLGIAALKHSGFLDDVKPNQEQAEAEKKSKASKTNDADAKQDQQEKAGLETSSRLTYFLLATIVPLLVARTIIPKLYTVSVVQKIIQEEDFFKINPRATSSLTQFLVKKHGPAGLLAQAFFTRTLIAAFLLEGAAMMAIVAYFLEGETAALIAAAVMIVLLLLLLPTAGGFTDWVRSELRMITDHRQFETSITPAED